MAFNHSLGREKTFDLLPEVNNIAAFLMTSGATVRRAEDVSGCKATHPQPFRALRTESQTFEPQTDTGLALACVVGLLITFL